MHLCLPCGFDEGVFHGIFAKPEWNVKYQIFGHPTTVRSEDLYFALIGFGIDAACLRQHPVIIFTGHKEALLATG